MLLLVIFVCFSLVIQSACEETWQTYDNIIDSGAKVPEWWDIPRKFEREIEVLNDEEFSNRFHDEFFLKKPVVLRGWQSPAIRQLRDKLQKSALKSEFGNTEIRTFTQEELRVNREIESNRKTHLSKFIDKDMLKQKGKLYLYDQDFFSTTGLAANWTLPPGLCKLSGYNHMHGHISAAEQKVVGFDKFFMNGEHGLVMDKERRHVEVAPSDNSRLTFALAPDSGGIGLHSHNDGYNVLLIGKKRWIIYGPQGMRGGVPLTPENHNLMNWIKAYRASSPSPTWDFVQEEGDVVYIPESFYHGTMSMGESVAVAHTAERPMGAMLHYQKGIVGAIKPDDIDSEILELHQAVAMNPTHYDFQLALARRYEARDDWDSTLTWAKSSAKLNPFYEPPSWLTYKMQRRMQQKKAAEEYLKDAVSRKIRNAKDWWMWQDPPEVRSHMIKLGYEEI